MIVAVHSGMACMGHFLISKRYKRHTLKTPHAGLNTPGHKASLWTLETGQSLACSSYVQHIGIIFMWFDALAAIFRLYRSNNHDGQSFLRLFSLYLRFWWVIGREVVTKKNRRDVFADAAQEKGCL